MHKSAGSTLPAASGSLTAADLKASRRQPPRLGNGDPRQVRRVARGRLPIGGTLDLHGLTQVSAHHALTRFIDKAALRGDAIVLVITGKGQDEAERIPFEEAPRGVLRRRFLEWIEEPTFKRRIASVHPAHQRHGGRGAFYVFLKRN